MKTIQFPNITNTSVLHKLRREQSTLTRRAYNRHQDGLSEAQIYKECKSPKLNWIQNISAIKRGIAVAASRNEAKQLHDLTTETIFGSKSEFIRRCKGLISRDQWRTRRLQPLYVIGDAGHRGNRHVRIDYENRRITYKDKQHEVVFSIPRMKANYELILQEIAEKTSSNEMPITVAIGEQISISFDETKLSCYQQKYLPYRQKSGVYLGIDMNPDRLGIGIWCGDRYIYAEQFELVSNNQNERRNELYKAVDAVYRLMCHYHVSCVGVEDLDIRSKDHGGKALNRKINNLWSRQLIVNKLEMICRLACVRCRKILPQYSSFVGNINHPELGDCCAAAVEMARRCGGRFYPRVPLSTDLEHRWKEMAGSGGWSTWKELYEVYKKRDIGWRSSPRMVGRFRFGTHSDRMLVYRIGERSLLCA